VSAARDGRVQAAMARHGVGALCLATPHLATFASGARRVRVAGSGGTVPWVVVRAGVPSATIFTTDPDGAPPGMPRAAVRPLGWDRDRQLAAIADLVRDVPGAVACDVLTPALRDALAGRALVDAAPVLADAAAPRSAAEVAAVVAALAAARAALRAAATAVVPDGLAADVWARSAGTVAEQRAGFPLHEGLVRRAGRDVRADERFARGDVVQLEFGLWLGEHAGVAAGTVGCDVDLSASRRQWDEALCALASTCRDGASTRALRETAARASIDASGVLVHGLGVGVEPPLVDLDDDADVMLRAGTVLVLAPVVAGFRATRTLLVTERVHRWLEPAP
jgi:Xaa-Pro aminopeptidase